MASALKQNESYTMTKSLILAAVITCCIHNAQSQQTLVPTSNQWDYIKLSTPSIPLMLEGTVNQVQVFFLEPSTLGLDNYNVNITSSDTEVAVVANDSIIVNQNKTNHTISILAHLLGKSMLIFSLYTDKNTTNTLTVIHQEEHSIGVIIPESVLDIIFTAIMGLVLFTVNIMFGLQMEIKIIKEIGKKPIQPAIGFLCQFLFMPLLALGIAKLLPLSNESGLGLLAVGSCPGGGASNVFSYILDGDITLSLMMTFISNVASIGMTTLWVWLLGQFFIENHTAQFTMESSIILIVVLVIAVGIGLALQKWAPAFGEKFSKVIRPILVIVCLGFGAYSIYAKFWVFRFISGWQVLAGVMLAVSGYLAGGLTAKVFRQTWPRVKTIAIETGVQNAALALLIVDTALPQPDSNMAYGQPMVCMASQMIPLILAAITYKIYKKKCYKSAAEESLDQKPSKDKIILHASSKENKEDNPQQVEETENESP